MRIQGFFRIILCALLAVVAVSGAAFGNCFDFSKKVETPLREPQALEKGQDATAFGKYDNGTTWGKVRGTIDKPIDKVLQLLLDHNNTKSSRVHEMKVDKKEDPNYLARHTVYFKIKPFLFITVEWREDWGYALAAGTPADPSRIVISYQKIEGTSHIEHLCGNIVLNKLSSTQTDVYEYEEAKATQRSPEDTVNGLLGTLKTLRK
jgi:hypothetical protein